MAMPPIGTDSAASSPEEEAWWKVSETAAGRIIRGYVEGQATPANEVNSPEDIGLCNRIAATEQRIIVIEHALHDLRHQVSHSDGYSRGLMSSILALQDRLKRLADVVQAVDAKIDVLAQRDELAGPS